jgi:hypothetical protein
LVGSLLTVAVNGCATFSGNSVPTGATATTIAGTVTDAVLAAPLLATEVAVNVTLTSLAGGVPGAVYVVATPLAVDVGETVPHGVGEQDTDQTTPKFAESFVTVAVNWPVPPNRTLAEPGSIETLIPGTVTLAELDAAALATAAAVMVTPKSPAGVGVGAVYVTTPPLAVVIGKTLPHGTVPHDTDQVSPSLLGSLAIVPAN